MENESYKEKLLANEKNIIQLGNPTNQSYITDDSSGILLKMSSDVEEKSKESLEEIYEKYRLVALNSSDLIAFTTADFDLIFTFANPSYKKILGYENEELLGRSGLSFIHNDDKKHIVQQLLTFLDSRKNDGLSKEKAKFTHNIDFRFLDKSGQWHFLQSTIDIVNGEFLIISKDITKQKQAEEKLHRSEEMFSKAFRLSPESITLTSLKEGRYVDVNESFLHVIGYSRDEVIGRTATELNIWVDPNDRAKFIQGLKEQGSIRNLELRMRTKSGGVGTVLMSSEIITVNGETCALTVTTNITDRKRTEETLQENEKRLKSIIQGLSMAAFVIDSNHQVLYWNKALEQLSNIPAEEIVGTTNQWKAFYPQKRPCMGDILIDGGLNDIEKWYAGRYKKSSLLDESFEATDFFPNLGSDGKWLRLTATVIRNTSGDLIGVLETLEDISERKKVEDALRESEAKYRSVFNNFVDLYYQTDMQGLIINVSPSCFVLSGWKPEELIGRQVLEFYPDPEQRKALIEKLHRDGAVSNYETALLNRDGRHLSVSVSSHLIRDEQGNPKYVEGTIRDITERKREDEALAQQNEALSQLNHFSIELSMLSSEDNLEAFIIKRIKEIAGAEVAIFSEYNSTNRTTTTKHIEMEPGLLEKVVSLLGTQVTKIHSVVTDEMYQQMTTEIIGFQKTLHEVSLGAISRPVGAAIQALLKVDRFIGLAYIINGKLYGTSILGMKKGQPDPPKQILENFIFMAAVSLRRKLAEEELRRSEEQYRLVTDNASDIIWTMDLNLRFTYFSPSNEKLTGYTTEKALTLSLDELLTPESMERALQAFTAQMELENNPEKDLFRSVTLELNEKRADGTIFPVEVRMCFLRDAQNNPVGILGITRDISERKKQEAALQKSEEKFLKAFKSSPAAISITRVSDGKFVECNEAFELISGYQHSELIGRSPIELNLWIDRNDQKDISATLEKVGAIHNRESRFLTKTGAAIVTRFSCEIIDINQEKCVLSVLMDITDQKKMEESVRESEERYRSIVENTQDVIMLTNPDATVSYLSPACSRVIGYSQDELTGKIPEIFHPDDVEKVRTALSNAVKGASGSNLEYRILTKNGTIRWVSHSWSPVFTMNHELRHVVSVVRDVTEMKIAEQMLKTKIEELEKYKNVTVNREVKMVDLKNEINELCKQLNQKPKYPSV